MANIGIVMLMGLVTKNAILLIDFVKQQREKGVSMFDAVLIAGPIRFKTDFDDNFRNCIRDVAPWH